MNQLSFYKMCLSLGAEPSSTNFAVKREDFVSWMKTHGYADRTIANHAAPSRTGGVINQLLADGLLAPAGPLRWLVPCVQSLAWVKAKEKPPVVKMFSGNAPSKADGWITSSRLDDYSDQSTQWRLFRKEYAPNCQNLKVAALGERVPHKANFWLTSKDGKLLMTKNALLLKQHRLDIFDNLVEELQHL